MTWISSTARSIVLDNQWLYTYAIIAVLLLHFVEVFFQSFFLEAYNGSAGIIGACESIVLFSGILVGEYIHRNCVWKKSAAYGLIIGSVVNLMYEIGFVSDDYVLWFRGAIYFVAVFATIKFYLDSVLAKA